MTLSSMVLSRDWQEISVLECILRSLQMDVTVESDPQRALTRLTRSKIDALVVDCDMTDSAMFLRELHRADRRAPAAPLVLLCRANSAARLEAAEVPFAIEKPVSVEEAVHTLSAARNLIVDARLHYHRAGLEVPVSVNCKGGSRAAAHLVNLSEGGMQIHTDDPVEANHPLHVTFTLPGAKSLLKAQAEIAWRDQRGNLGIRFVKLPSRQQRTLQLWLARQYFSD